MKSVFMAPWQSVFKQMTIYSFEWRNRKTYSYWKSWFPFSMKRLDTKNINRLWLEQLPLLSYNKQNSQDTLFHSNLQCRMITDELLGWCSSSLVLCTMNNSLHHLRGGSTRLLQSWECCADTMHNNIVRKYIYVIQNGSRKCSSQICCSYCCLSRAFLIL